MADIELRERLFGGGFQGKVDLPAAQPTLSWADSRALRQSAEGAMASALQLRSLNTNVATLGASIAALEANLGLRLEAQTRILASQLDVLERIEGALRRPGQVRAAERIANTAELLRRGRYERALRDAEIAIEDDPINPAGFVAAGWSAIGLGQGNAAQRFFLEAGEASDGDARATALRQAARITFALEDGAAALAVLDGCDEQTSAMQDLAINYDRAVYLAARQNHDAAREALQRVLESDERFAPMVLADAVLSRHSMYRDMAADVVRRLTEALGSHEHAIRNDLQATEVALDAYDGPAPAQLLSSRDQLRAEAIGLRDEAQAVDDDATLRDRAEFLRPLRDRAATLRERAERWPSAAQEAHEQERADSVRQEAERELEDAVRRFAAQMAAMPTKKPDGSWVITKEKRLRGSKEAWRAQSAGGAISIDSIPWRSRYSWD